ncbi:uridine kinase [Scopulibacillus darangshiensis]|uniref:Uridine kinase n=1 Tax=Scopulibacillus darangshiensis TaxID=442528 RepID=A0A4R2NET5_9BACL|nr:AAA family ATPase [Scopulibacillus darangshiensis]TCP19757.1 uridine kinase [Scopulibacillus darangshiensis]
MLNFQTQSGQLYTPDELISLFHSKPSRFETKIVGIDGCGGSGKSTLAATLAKEARGTTVVHMDDFYKLSSDIQATNPEFKPVGSDFDWLRLEDQVLNPLFKNRNTSYQRYDWDTDELKEWHDVPSGGLVIIEGTFTTRNELFDYYDWTIWVNCPRDLRLARGIERDSEEARHMWEHNWMVAEDRYIRTHQPHRRADLIIDGY